jgi:hypothetical protein
MADDHHLRIWPERAQKDAPLDALRAYKNGSENVAPSLGPTCAPALK